MGPVAADLRSLVGSGPSGGRPPQQRTNSSNDILFKLHCGRSCRPRSKPGGVPLGMAVVSTGGRNRTYDPRIWNPLLYRLSYARMEGELGQRLLETRCFANRAGLPEIEQPRRVIQPLGAVCERCRYYRTSSIGSASRLHAEPLFSGSYAHRRSRTIGRCVCGGRGF